jgi:hypothetical protein
MRIFTVVGRPKQICIHTVLYVPLEKLINLKSMNEKKTLIF